MKTKLLAVLFIAPLLAACTPHRTGATEVGIKFNKITGSTEEMDAGATYFFMPFVNDWKTYDTSTQSLLMVSSNAEGDRKEKDDLRFKTRDGNDIDTDITVRWRIEPSRVSEVWRLVAPTTDEVKDRLVRPLARSYVRDVLN